MSDPPTRDGPKGLNYDVYIERRKELAAAVGLAITEWSMIEHTLVEIFAMITQLPRVIVAEIVRPLKTFALLLDMTDGVVRAVHDKKDLTYWVSLVDWVRELSGDRNYLAHSAIVCHDLDDPNTGDWGAATPKIAERVNDFDTSGFGI